MSVGKAEHWPSLVYFAVHAKAFCHMCDFHYPCDPARHAYVPSYDICRTQQDVEIQGDWKKLLNEVRDSHWMMAYGDYLKELGYACQKLGLNWVNLSEPQQWR